MANKKKKDGQADTQNAAAEIYPALRGRFFISRLILIVILLAVCAAVSAGAGFLLTGFYAEHFEGDREAVPVPPFAPAAIFGPHIPLLLAGALGFLCLITGMIFLIQALLGRRLYALIRRPLEDLSGGLDRLLTGEAVPGLNGGSPGQGEKGLFRPLYEAFEAAAPLLWPGGPAEDCRPPLEILRRGLEGLERALESAPAIRRKNLEDLEQRAAALKRLVDDIILLSALGGGEFPAAPAPLELGRFLGSLVRELGEEYRNRGLFLEFMESMENREALWVNVDGPWLRNVLVRLLNYSAANRRLDRGAAFISCRRRIHGPPDAETAAPALGEISVADNGPGLSAGQLHSLFEGPPFPPGGHHPESLGLAAAARIVNRLGGGIYAENSPGGGLRAVICFPLE